MIKDTGERREFETGAVRDTPEGKGRCDLLPIDIVANIVPTNDVLKDIAMYQLNKGTKWLYKAILDFAAVNGWSVPTLVLEVAKHFEEGAEKYGEYNWQKGIPLHCYIDSGVRHYLKWVRGDIDENHDRAFVWNMLCALWTIEHKPDLDDIPDMLPDSTK